MPVGAYTKKQTAGYKQQTITGFKVTSGTLDGTTTTETIELGGVASKISLQSTGTLAFTYTVSLTGEVFDTGGTVAATALSSYSTHNVAVVKITRTSGTGRVTIASVG